MIGPLSNMKKAFLWAALCCCMGFAIAQQKPCANVNAGAVTPAIPLPSLPAAAFKTVVRAVILNKNFTMEATEYVDESVDSAALVIQQGGVKGIIIMSYATDEIFFMGPNPDPNSPIAGPMMCDAQNLTTNEDSQLFGFGAGGSGSQTHLFSTSRILNFINGTEVYKGRTTITGIPANKWSSCVYWSHLNANFSVDYYFTAPGWQTPSGLQQVPLRAEVQGIRNYNNGTITSYHHIYDYLDFLPYVNDPETIFETPPGVYCLYRKPVRQPPTLNRNFFFREEVSNPGADNGGTSILSESDIWYTQDLQLVRYDRRTLPGGVSKDFSLSKGPFTTIHDYTIGVQYVIARDVGECSVDPIPISAKTVDGIYNIVNKTITMRTPMQFLNLNESNFLYAGQRLARAQKCDVFQTVLTNLPGHGIVIYEVYFLSPYTIDIGDRGSPSTSPKAVPMRILVWEAGVLVNQYEIHDFDQDFMVATSFDVTPCFPGSSSTDFELFLSVKDTNLMPQLSPYLQQVMTLSLTVNVGISPIRLQRTRLHWGSANVYFEGTLLDTAPSIAKYAATKGTIMQAGAGKALQNIMAAPDCAYQCDHLTEWNCVQFDYCSSTQVCTLGRGSGQPTLQNNTQCSHYQRVLGGGFDSQVSLSTAWQNLKNLVYGKQLAITMPLPDASGKVDLTVDTSTLDDTQKITFNAYAITDQVVSSVSRNPGSSSIMAQFNSIPNKQGKGHDTLIRGVSVDDCANNCVNEQTYNCQSFAYCWEAGACFMSRQHPDERPDLLKDSPACDLYYRDYTSNFQKFAGVTVLSSSKAVYQTVASASQCAKLCTYYSTFHCESFDFCNNINTCFLGKTHYYDTPRANIKQEPSCSHYSRNYIQDFVAESHKQVPLRDNLIIQDVSPQQCAKLCVQEGSFKCNSFDYCANHTECRLSDALVANTGQVTLESTASCDVYLRTYDKAPSGQTSTAKPTTNGNHGHTQGHSASSSSSNQHSRASTAKPTTNGNHGHTQGHSARASTAKPTSNGNHGHTQRQPASSSSSNQHSGASTAKPTTNGNYGHTEGHSASSSSSNKYSAGAMGGLAIGMIALGLILGLVAMFLYTRHFARPPLSDSIQLNEREL